MLQVYLIYFDLKDMKIKAEVLKLKNKSFEELDDQKEDGGSFFFGK